MTRPTTLSVTRRTLPALLAVLMVPIVLLLTPPAFPAPPDEPITVRLGIDRVLSQPGTLVGRRIGLVTHLAGVTHDGQPSIAALARKPGVRLTALFAPEHGLDGTLDAGAPVPTIPGRTPVYSLYGGSFRPTRAMLGRVDVLVVDLQDVGTRPYTYASTMAHVMEAASEARKSIVILDRPNPLGGLIVDGPVLEPQFRSFIGMYPIPLIHGMTMGELASLYNKAFGIGADLTVAPMEGWSRNMAWMDTGLVWINPSPGITTQDAPFYYAATGPLDGTNLWNGVATSSRYQVALAPWIDGVRLAERLNRRGLPGVRFIPSAVPHPRTGRIWRGVRLQITDRQTFRPATTTVYLLAELRQLHGSKLAFRHPGRGRYLFDIVWGTKDVRLGIMRGESGAAIVARWQPALTRFQKIRESYLLYR